jgi:hypothetical protein
VSGALPEPALPEPMSVAQIAAVRACALLAERHQPLTMTPGDLRTLLGRYQRRLHDLAEAVLPAAATAGDAAHGPGSSEGVDALPGPDDALPGAQASAPSPELHARPGRRRE